jgi:hypothetical protein
VLVKLFLSFELVQEFVKGHIIMLICEDDGDG